MNLDPTHSKRCPFCLALNQIDETRCFLCDHEFGAIDPSRPIDMTRPKDQADSLNQLLLNMLFHLVGTFLVVASIVFTVVLILISPGVGIALVIIVVPALLRTLVVVDRRKSLKDPPNFFDKAVIFFVSLFVTVGVLSLVAAAGFMLLFIICISR